MVTSGCNVPTCIFKAVGKLEARAISRKQRENGATSRGWINKVCTLSVSSLACVRAFGPYEYTHDTNDQGNVGNFLLIPKLECKLLRGGIVQSEVWWEKDELGHYWK